MGGAGGLAPLPFEKTTTTSLAGAVSQAFGLLCSAPLEFPEAKASGTYIVSHLKRTTTTSACYVSQAFGLLCSAPLEFPEVKASGTYIV